jgi:hypothetical protein
MRRGWLSVVVGLVIAAGLTAAMYIRVTHSLFGGGREDLSLTLAFPPLLYLNLPGIALMWLTLFLTPVNANSSQVFMQLLVAIGNAIFYGLAAYVVVGLAARWRQT